MQEQEIRGERTGMTTQSRKKPGVRHVRFWLLLAAVVLGIFALGILTAWCASPRYIPASLQAQMDILPDNRAKSGTLHRREDKEIGEGEFWVVMNQIPMVTAGSTECNLEYEMCIRDREIRMEIVTFW